MRIWSASQMQFFTPAQCYTGSACPLTSLKHQKCCINGQCGGAVALTWPSGRGVTAASWKGSGRSKARGRVAMWKHTSRAIPALLLVHLQCQLPTTLPLSVNNSNTAARRLSKCPHCPQLKCNSQPVPFVWLLMCVIEGKAHTNVQIGLGCTEPSKRCIHFFNEEFLCFLESMAFTGS